MTNVNSTIEQIEKLEQQIESLTQQKNQLLANFEMNDQSFPKTKLGNDRVVVIGGNGQLGHLFVNYFTRSGYCVSVIDSEDWENENVFQQLNSAALILIAVPIHVTIETIDKLRNLPSDCVLADITSVKSKPLEKMKSVHVGPIVGLHPMFGGDVKSFAKQTLIVCNGRSEKEYQWLLEQLSTWHLKLHHCTAEQHDKTMSIVQVLRHFSTVAYGVHLREEEVILEQVLAMSSPIYRLELAMVGRLFAQSCDLYTEIIFSNPQNIDMMERFIERFKYLLELIRQNNKELFKKEFAKTRHWFGVYAKEFQIESGKMLNQFKLQQTEN